MAYLCGQQQGRAGISVFAKAFWRTSGVPAEAFLSGEPHHWASGHLVHTRKKNIFGPAASQNLAAEQPAKIPSDCVSKFALTTSEGWDIAEHRSVGSGNMPWPRRYGVWNFIKISLPSRMRISRTLPCESENYGLSFYSPLVA